MGGQLVIGAVRGATRSFSEQTTAPAEPNTTEPHRRASVRLCPQKGARDWVLALARGPLFSRTGHSFSCEYPLVGGAGGNRTRVLRRRTRASPGAVSAVVFSAPALALTRRRQAQPQKSPAGSSWPGHCSKPPR